ncbi:MAG: hypothetical protein AVDCRST_MAG35-2131, partial [uncultured Quadrisphaera sp.]
AAQAAQGPEGPAARAGLRAQRAVRAALARDPRRGGAAGLGAGHQRGRPRRVAGDDGAGLRGPGRHRGVGQRQQPVLARGPHPGAAGRERARDGPGRADQRRLGRARAGHPRRRRTGGRRPGAGAAAAPGPGQGRLVPPGRL